MGTVHALRPHLLLPGNLAAFFSTRWISALHRIPVPSAVSAHKPLDSLLQRSAVPRMWGGGRGRERERRKGKPRDPGNAGQEGEGGREER